MSGRRDSASGATTQRRSPTSRNASGGPTKSLRCVFPGCGKVFTRKDHLIRHAANHSQPNFHCTTCGRSFQRLDLLQRHERRRICDDERYPKRMRSSAAPRTGAGNPPSGAAASSSVAAAQGPVDHSSTSSADSAGVGMPPPSPHSMHQTQHPYHYAHAHPASHHSSSTHSVASSHMVPMLDPAMLDHLAGDGSVPHSAGAGAPPEFDMSATGPVVLEPQQTDFGFGLWPPDPWEVLLHDSVPPAIWDHKTAPVQDTAFDFDELLHGPARAQESAERGGVIGHHGHGYHGHGHGHGHNTGAGVGGGEMREVSDMLLARLTTSYPEFDMTLPELDDALELYWTHVAPSFPFIHKGTFAIDSVPAELVIMMAVTGAVRSPALLADTAGHPPRQQRRDDRALVRTIRANLVKDRCGLKMELATLQTYTLCHVYDVWHGNTESQFVAQIMWPVVVAHGRKQGIGVSGGVAPDGDGVAAWVAWAKDEERRRAAYAILFIDTQISAFWSQHPSRQLSIFAHNLHMPCPRAQWEALSAADWARARQAAAADGPERPMRMSRHGFLPGLHPEFQVSTVSEGYSSAVLAALAADGAPPIKVDLDNAFGVAMVLSGLVAIAWDCRTRGGMGIRFRDGTKHWRSIVLNAVVTLRAAHELVSGHLPGSVESRDLRDSLAISIISILSDIPMLQVAAGASNICGAAIGPKQYADSKRRLRLWVATQDAWTCLWQSARYLREALLTDWGLYSPWAVFLTTLVVWAYGAALSDDRHYPSQRASEHPQCAAAATALLDGIYASPTRVDALDVGVADLLVTAAARLEALGQPIDRDNAMLLWRLGKR